MAIKPFNILTKLKHYNKTLPEAGSLPALHSAKPLPSATLGKEPPSNPLLVKAALPSAKFRALGKDLTPSADAV